jgi:hypothetical protein
VRGFRSGTSTRQSYPHFTQVDGLFLSGRRVYLDDSQRCSDAQGTVQDVDTKNDRVALTESGNDLETTGPDRLRCGITTFGLRYLVVVGLERVEQVVNDVRCMNR